MVVDIDPFMNMNIAMISFHEPKETGSIDKGNDLIQHVWKSKVK